jgi:hypothetical protein
MEAKNSADAASFPNPLQAVQVTQKEGHLWERTQQHNGHQKQKGDSREKLTVLPIPAMQGDQNIGYHTTLKCVKRVILRMVPSQAKSSTSNNTIYSLFHRYLQYLSRYSKSSRIGSSRKPRGPLEGAYLQFICNLDAV